MAAASQTSIANRGLQHLGAQRVDTITQDRPNARSMLAAYDFVRKSLLREYTWNFAIKRKSIPADSTGTVYEGLNRFLLPNDFVRLLRQQKSIQGDSSRKDWQIEGGYIVTADAAPLTIRYIADIEDPALFDDCFVELLAVQLAIATCEEVTGSKDLMTTLLDKEARALIVARRSNAFENDADVPLEDDWLLARL